MALSRSAPACARTPILADDHGVAVAPQGLVQPVGVVDEVGDGVAPAGRDGGAGKAAHEGGHRPKPGLGTSRWTPPAWQKCSPVPGSRL